MILKGFSSENKHITVQFTDNEIASLLHGMMNFCNNEVHKDFCSCIETRDQVTSDLKCVYQVITGEYEFTKKQ